MKETQILTTISGLIMGAGRSRRFGKSTNKIFELVGDRPVIAYTISAFENCDRIDEIVLVVGKDDVKAAQKLVGRFNFGKVKKIVAGGEHRQDSVRMGLQEISGEVVAIHDGARPMITPDIIVKSIDCALEYDACIVAVPVVDTIKTTDVEGYVDATIDRSNLYAVQTPQTFKTDLIKKAHDRALAERFYTTDDAALVERFGKRVHIVQGSYDNIKITTQSDMDIARAKLGGFQMRTGMGFDVHTLVEDRKLMLGGVEIPFEKGLLGHSDADVLVHSIMDALLGAAGLGDIGRHFPDTRKKYKDADSLKLLIKVGNMLSDKSFSILNIDVTLVCQNPKISPYMNEMISNISDALQIDGSQVNIKATTTEGLGYTGKGEGIACYAVANISK